MRFSARGFVGIGSLACLLACGSSPPPAFTPANGEAPAKKAAPRENAAASADAHSKALIDEMLQVVSRTRGLPIKRPVPGKVLGRDEMLARIKATVERDTPKDWLIGQGEVLASLESVPAGYDFVAGTFELMGGRVAGFYDPDEGEMVLADDLDEDEARETLAHELAHALADQSFPLKPMVKFAPGENDRLSAVHSVIEGDATSAMLDVTLGSAFEMTEEGVRLAFSVSTQMSEVGAKTPRAINSSLIAPYVDGFSFIQEVRRRGNDWRAVDDVWQRMPESTEQLLHVDKLIAHEPAEKIDQPSFGELAKQGYKVLLDDVMGEQGYRITFEDWTTRAEARDAAAGWGGDRLVVLSRSSGGKNQYGMVLRLRMDTPRDAEEAARLFERKFGKACHERPAMGPLSWEARGRDIALVAGPYERDGKTAKSIADCEGAGRWLSEVWRAAPPLGENAKGRPSR